MAGGRLPGLSGLRSVLQSPVVRGIVLNRKDFTSACVCAGSGWRVRAPERGALRRTCACGWGRSSLIHARTHERRRGQQCVQRRRFGGAQKDFTVTVTPATDLWLRFGRTWINGNIKEDIVYYQKYASERSANSTYKVSWVIAQPPDAQPWSELPGHARAAGIRNRRAVAAKRNRLQRHGRDSGAVEDVFRCPRRSSNHGLRRSRRVSRHQPADELNRTVTTGALTLRHQDAVDEHHVRCVARTGSLRVLARPRHRFDGDHGGVKFDPFALIKGSATFGYRDFKPLSPAVPGYQGSTVAVDLSYVALGSTKLAVTLTRDVQYSYDINQPYYLQTGATGSISQQIFGPVDVVGRIGARSSNIAIAQERSSLCPTGSITSQVLRRGPWVSPGARHAYRFQY